MRRDRRAAPSFDDDATVVDYVAADRARDGFDSFHDAKTVVRPLAPMGRPVDDRARGAADSLPEVTTVTRPLPFDDLPTTVWTPRPPKPVVPEAKPSVSTRRLRSVADTGPNVRIAPSHVAWSDREEVTRIEAPPLPVKSTEETTAPGQARRRAFARRRLSPIGVVCAVLIALIVVASVALWHRRHPHGLAPAPIAAPAPITALAPVAAPRSPATPSAATTPAPRIVASPSVPTPTVPAVPTAPSARVAPPPATASLGVVPPSTDEAAAVEAVESGDITGAARLYAALAASHPGNEGYREAARILLDGAKESHP